ncbi:hypothetical protein [Actinoplanes friuliensis]|uniref:Lipoprotein n=1 Tax=Actinoplanes friuliensis DSM 7358 TaxID=1246995 RepID=U5W7Q2_9ACTN|nr:hypothetical protein [Actinoplanes friuliensis]AGZ44020.1 hypothetical protein AFR_28795 [Actinoplanes friuliensis DSM 7358]
MSRSQCYLAIVMSALMVGGCADGNKSRTPEPQQPSSPVPASTRASAFCLDLGTFQFAVVVYVGEAGKAIEGKPLDFEELRRQSDNIARIGKPMRADAPADIRKEFGIVLDAVATSRKALRAGGSPKDLVDPLYGSENRPAFDAVNKYDCAK